VARHERHRIRALGKRYRRGWALRDCTLGIPGGHIVALVGPNGAGKTTLLTLATGLTRPTSGQVTVLGGLPAGSPDALDGIAFVAQDAPLYRNLPVRDMLRVARDLNRRWDPRRANGRLERLGIDRRSKVGELSGGQKAQLALTIALARRPALLVLDEPLAALDPVAREDFMASVVDETRDDGISVVLSSHVLAAVLLTAVTGAFTGLFYWYFRPFLADGQVSEFLPLAFGLLGVAFAAWTLFAYALAAFTGTLLRRMVPAG
jgi:ABC-type multidrug transport system ATPase subunit